MNRRGGEGVGESFSREIEMVPYDLRRDFAKQSQYGIASESAQTSRFGKLPHANAGGRNVSGGVGSGGGVPAIARLFEGNVSYDYRRLTPNTASAPCAPTSAAGPVL